MKAKAQPVWEQQGRAVSVWLMACHYLVRSRTFLLQVTHLMVAYSQQT